MIAKIIFFFSGIVVWILLLNYDMHAQVLLSKTGVWGNAPSSVRKAQPLDMLSLTGLAGKSIMITDGKDKVYKQTIAGSILNFQVGGALGIHTIWIKDMKGNKKQVASFEVDANTEIDDGGYYKNMFDLFYKGMCLYDIDGEESIDWNGKTYRYFVTWGLDHCHTMKGMKYFKGSGAEFVDLMRAIQREDGMIWSYVHTSNANVDYFLTRDKYTGYTKKIGDLYFTRQPTENHPEYIYVNTIYQCWKASGNDKWMRECLSSAARALDYSMNDPARWSKRFQLLKRVYTIDSWDFAVEDEYLPDIGVTNSMIIDPVKSKFGVFFGDNTGYSKACKELSEMYLHAGMKTEAAAFKLRANQISERLNTLAWNGKFFRHFIDEDSTVVRKLGVDESIQVAQSNAYSLNRDIKPEQNKAIIQTYQNLKAHLPQGSPGEWYAIYPPFQKGFERHDAIWQYMNGGVGGHVAGELALGAYESGYEHYGTDILNRLFELGKKYDNKIWFAYTGSILPPPPLPLYRTLDISAHTNMDHWDQGAASVFSWMNSKKKGDDLRHLPVGLHSLAGIPFNITDPVKNGRKSVIAVSKQKDFPVAVEIPVNDTAGAVYLLHTSTKPSSEQVAGVVSFIYEDGSKKVNYMIMEKQLTYWWFSQLKTDYSGIAWYGKNEVSEGVGLSWCAINNPFPQKKISKIIIQSPEDNGIYTVLGITLSNREHYVPVKPTSFGGPDNWAAATAMAALVEGLAGVKNASGAEAYSTAYFAPRWSTTKADSVNVCIRYPASGAYVAYQYIHNRQQKQIKLLLTANSNQTNAHIFLPNGIKMVRTVKLNGKTIAFRIVETAEGTNYADFSITSNAPSEIIIEY